MGPGGDAGPRAAAVRSRPAYVRRAPRGQCPAGPGLVHQALGAVGPETAWPGLGCPPGSGLVPCPPNAASLPRAAKQRRKGDRLVIACQEQTYWLVNRPPVSPLVCGEGWRGFSYSSEVLRGGSVFPSNALSGPTFRACGKDVAFGVPAGSCSSVTRQNPEITGPVRTPQQTSFFVA